MHVCSILILVAQMDLFSIHVATQFRLIYEVQPWMGISGEKQILEWFDNV